jgi:hypothetical protein
MRSLRFGLLAAASAVLLVASAGAASADTVTPLGVQNDGVHPAVTDLAVDAVHGHVFLASPTGRKVVVVGTAGGMVKSIPTSVAPHGVVIAGGLAFVMNCGSTVTLINTTTLTVTGSFSVTPAKPCDAAVANGRVWMSDTTFGLWSFPVVAPRPVKPYPGLKGGTLSSPSADSTSLYSVAQGTLARYDVSTATPTAAATVTGFGNQTIAAMPDGSGVVVAGSPVALYDPSLTQVRTYPGATSGTDFDVTVSPDAARIAVVEQTDDYSLAGPYTVFNVGSQTPTYTNLSSVSTSVDTFANIIALGSEPSVLYSVLSERDTSAVFRVMDVPATPSYLTRVTIAADGSAAAGGTATFSGHVSTLPLGGAAGRTVHLIGTPQGGTAQEIGSGTTDGSGNYTITTDPLNHTGTWALNAHVDGAGDYRDGGTLFERRIYVNGAATTVAVSASKAVVRYHQTVTVTASMAAFGSGGTVTISRVAGGVTSVAFTGPLDGAGQASVTLAPGRNTQYFATFNGDDTYNPATSAKVTVKVAPIVTGALLGGYGRSGVYKLYRYNSTCLRTYNAGCPQYLVTVSPNHFNHNATALIQVRTASGWKNVVAWRKLLGARSRAQFPIAYANASVIGHYYRIVGVFVHDGDHYDGVSGFAYFRITR